MNKKEVESLKLGIYRIHWKLDPTNPSIAAVGITKNGGRWLAPLNWVLPTDNQLDWGKVERVELVQLVAPDTHYIRVKHDTPITTLTGPKRYWSVAVVTSSGFQEVSTQARYDRVGATQEAERWSALLGYPVRIFDQIPTTTWETKEITQ